MTLTFNTLATMRTENNQLKVVQVTFDASYPTGGEAVAPSDLSLYSIDAIVPIPNGTSGYVPAWVPASNKITALMGDNNNASDGPLVEVANTTDLSAVTFTCIVVGR